MNRLNLGYLAGACLVLGIICMVVAIGFDTAPSGTHNIGLMQEQMLWSNFGSLMLLIGSILFVGNRLGNKFDALKDLQTK
jgi:hypothetical protein